MNENITVLAILEKLANTPSRKEKEMILLQNSTNHILKRVFYTAYNPEFNYWIRKTPKVSSYDGSLPLDSAIAKLLSTIANRTLTGNAAIAYYQKLLSYCTKENAEVLKRIVQRDLKCGVSIKTINKIWENLIPEYPFMNAMSDPRDLVFPCYVQPKYDGMRCEVSHLEDGTIRLMTRGGSQIETLSVMNESIRAIIPLGESWDGELICYDSKGPLPRKTSNGILNKAIRGTITEKEAEMVRFIAWDLVDKSGTIPYKERYEHIRKQVFFVYFNQSKIYISENYIASSLEEVEGLFQSFLDKGQEGVVAKNIQALWEPKRSYNLVKFKSEKTCDLVVVEWIEGEDNKYHGLLSAVICESADGKVRVNVGSGFSDEQRQLTADDILDKIVEVEYNERITKKDGGPDSLFLPRLKGIRWDKMNPNNNEEIL